MALVITVILLAVVTIMAITFLAVSRRERASVTTTTDTATAQLAADNALAAAEAQIVATTLATTNPYNFGLIVSTNFINGAGFDPKAGGSPTNVNYDYYIKGPGPLSVDDFLQNLANLYYLPRPPVYTTNYTYKDTELQFYLDLNRNARDDTNGVVGDFDNNGNYVGNISEIGDPEWIGILQHPDQPYGPNNPFVARYAFIAVPIGNALDLNSIHNDSMGISGKRPMTPVFDGFLRNQGAGSWEINLASFLADLNTNSWDNPVSGGVYDYREPIGLFDTGAAFDDAQSLLRNRYAGTYLSLSPVGGPNGLFTFSTFFPPFQNNIDYYSQGPLMTGPGGISVGTPNIQFSWSGSDNTNHFFDLQELYNTGSPVFGSFAGRLVSASQGSSTYNRYTYYRLLSQLGVDSTPAQNQMNLNYSNAVAYFARDRFNRIIPGVVTNIVFFPNAETNFAPWDPLQFFTIAADKMLRAYSQEWLAENPSNYMATYGSFTNISTVNPVINPTNVPAPFGVSDIPVLISNRFVYTPAVQRVLQLSANMYDATTNTLGVNGNTQNFPSVFRPIFWVTNENNGFGPDNVYIKGYQQVLSVQGSGDPVLALPVDVKSLSGVYGRGLVYANVFGVPWIIGAKKGFPNFNEIAIESTFQLTRKFQVTRPSTNSLSSTYSYNQMFNLSVTNQVGVEYWNSYTNDFMDSVAMYVTNIVTGVLSNDENFSFLLSSTNGNGLAIAPASYNNHGWPGYNPDNSGAPAQSILRSQYSFQLPMDTNVTMVTNSTYRFNGGAPFLTTNLDLPYEVGVIDPVTGSRFPQPHWRLIATNQTWGFILDTQTSPYHILDYAQFTGPNTTRDLTSEIITNYDQPVVSVNASGNEMWNTNFQAGIPVGILSQVGVSLDNYTPNAVTGSWDTKSIGTQNAIDAFRIFFHLSPIWNNSSGRSQFAVAAATNAWASPYQPTATVVQHIDWQVNDPLVHYTANDFNYPGALRYDRSPMDLTSPTNHTANLGQLNTRYMPWGGYPLAPGAMDFSGQNAYNIALKDPLVWRSDDWDFPAYKLPTVGWLGRVHRGTPWQTVYLKSPDILREYQVMPGNVTNRIGPATWVNWTGNSQALVVSNSFVYFDAGNAAPVQDRLLFDLFTTAPNDNATRGQLSVNVDANVPNDPQAGLAAWSAVFSGVQVLSNNAVFPMNQHNGSLQDFTAFPIQPAGANGAGSPLSQIVAGINRTRLNAENSIRIVSVNASGAVTNEIPAAFVNPDGIPGAFEHVGDILSVPELSDESPFLNWNNGTQLHGGISDEIYEWLPQQVMSLLRASGTPQSPMRYIIYSYGQALKPAADGISTRNTTLANGQSAFGMVTNYQVVAAYATRSVINFGSVVTNVVGMTNDFESGDPVLFSLRAVTNNTAQIQQFNVLPPY